MIDSSSVDLVDFTQSFDGNGVKVVRIGDTVVLRNRGSGRRRKAGDGSKPARGTGGAAGRESRGKGDMRAGVSAGDKDGGNDPEAH